MRAKKKKGCAKRFRPTRSERRLERMVQAARSPFERLCLLKWSFLDRERAVRRAKRGQRVVQCRFCGNWHLVPR